ncbi:MAG TPA: PLP-dependent aminotransferase family protein [Alphaproteobacteria bacterium]|nr:PLP-dependent aminotransferase family protein [Alphaproteobacteria bacterium]
MTRRSQDAFLDHVAVDRTAAEPMSVQLYRALKDLILSGGLKRRAKLPATRPLAGRLGVSRNTVLTAFELLAAEGYVESVHGAGTFVAAALPFETLAAADCATGPVIPSRLSHRGEQMRRIDLPPAGRPLVFTPGIPALDEFPLDDWRRLLARTGRRFGRDLLYLDDARGWWPLREAIAAHVGPARGVACTADQVIVLSSARQGVELAARLLADPGDAVWMEEPGYPETRAVLLGAGLRPAPIPVDKAGIDVSAGRATAPQARLACVTPSHQYPLGATMSLKRRLELLDWARGAGAWVVEDDYDGEFRYGGRPITALYGLDGGDRVLYVGTFSKVMFPSLRLAYMICPAPLVEAFAAARAQLDGHSSAVAQAALGEFMESGAFGAHIRRMRGLYRQRQDHLIDLVHRHLAGRLAIEPSQAGLHLVGRLVDGTSDVAVLDRAPSNRIGPSPLSRYFTGPSTATGLILGYAAWNRSALERGVESLARALEAAEVAP